MPTVRQMVVEAVPTVFGLGSSGSDTARAAFISSPAYRAGSGYQLDAEVREGFENPVDVNGTPDLDTNGNINSPSVGVPVNMFFSEATDYQVVDTTETGAGGRPATAWSPNIISPGEGNGDNPAAIREGRAATLAVKGGGNVLEGGGLTSPSQTVARIFPRGSRRIGNWALGSTTRI